MHNIVVEEEVEEATAYKDVSHNAGFALNRKNMEVLKSRLAVPLKTYHWIDKRLLKTKIFQIKFLYLVNNVNQLNVWKCCNYNL